MPETATPGETPAATPTPSAPPSAPEPSPAPNGAAPPPNTPPEGGGTLIEGAGEGGEGGPTPGDWPDNWRDIASGGDQKTKQYLSRYASPANVVKALMATRQKMSAGDLIRAKPEGDPNDPQVKQALQEWRAQANVPETPDGYLEKVPDGLVFGDADKPILEGFLQDMHAKDAPPAFVHSALQWYKGFEQKQAEEQAVADKSRRARADDDLRSEWGPEYRPNLNGAIDMLKTHGPEGLADRLFSARMADGTLFGDDPDTLRFLVALNRQINPHGVIPTPDSPQGKAMISEMETIRKAMGDSNSDYWRGPKDASGETQMQRRYRELTELQQKRAGR